MRKTAKNTSSFVKQTPASINAKIKGEKASYYGGKEFEKPIKKVITITGEITATDSTGDAATFFDIFKYADGETINRALKFRKYKTEDTFIPINMSENMKATYDKTSNGKNAAFIITVDGKQFFVNKFVVKTEKGDEYEGLSWSEFCGKLIDGGLVQFQSRFESVVKPKYATPAPAPAIAE